MHDKAVHFRAALFSSSELRPRRKIYTDSKVFEGTRVGKVFLYINARVHTPVICRNPENQCLRLGLKRIHVRLILTIPTMARSAQGTDERTRMHSLGIVSGRLPADDMP